ncbi:NUDIX hydrolase [Nocardia brasiliensis]
MSFRLAAYAVCLDDGRLLLTRHMPSSGDPNWTLPGGRVEHGEDPYDAVPLTGHVAAVPVGGLIQH